MNQRHVDYRDLPIGPNNENYWYGVAARSNMGYNYEFMSPWIYTTQNNDVFAGSSPISLSAAANSSSTLMQADSLWDRNTYGTPKGGGNWVVEPPCVYDINGNLMEPMAALKAQRIWYYYGYPSNGGWQVGNTRSWLEFGGCWPWFTKRFRVSYMDGHIGTVALGRLSAGCDVRSRWAGRVTDHDLYIWDLQ